MPGKKEINKTHEDSIDELCETIDSEVATQGNNEEPFEMPYDDYEAAVQRSDMESDLDEAELNKESGWPTE